MSASAGEAILAMFESDLVSVAGAPLLTLLTSLKAHAGNVPMQVADWIQFTAALPGSGIVLAVELEQQLLTAAVTKLQGYMASKAPGVSG